jgi:hypothetical protein
MRRIVGPGGGGQSLEFAASFEPRGESDAKLDCNFSEKLLQVKMELSLREPMRAKRRIGVSNSHLLRTE